MLSAVLASMALQGASAAAGVPTEAMAPPGENQALVYIYRQKRFALAVRRAAFLVDDVQVADIYGGACTFLRVPAGTHVLKQKWAFDAILGALKLNTDWRAGQSYYYELDTEVGGSRPIGRMRIGARLQRVSPETGAKAMSACAYKPADNVEKLGGSTAAVPAEPSSSTPPTSGDEAH
jgi:hypothetical protein